MKNMKNSLLVQLTKKNTFGPTPIEFAAIVNSMISDKEIEKIKSAYYQKKYLPLRKPNLDCLSGKEIGLIDEVLNLLSDKNASQISHYSQRDIPWKVTGDMEVIDYETVFYRTPEYSVRNNEQRNLSAIKQASIKEGHEEGLKEGEKKGRKEEKLAFAKKLLKKGMMSIDEIAEITELDIEEVQALEQAKTIKN